MIEFYFFVVVVVGALFDVRLLFIKLLFFFGQILNITIAPHALEVVDIWPEARTKSLDKKRYP